MSLTLRHSTNSHALLRILGTGGQRSLRVALPFLPPPFLPHHFLPPHHCIPATRDFTLVGMLLCRGHLCRVSFTSSSVSSTNVSSELALLYGRFLCHSLSQVLLRSHLQFCPMHTSLLLPRYDNRNSVEAPAKRFTISSW